MAEYVNSGSRSKNNDTEVNYTKKRMEGKRATQFMKEYPPLKLPILHQNVDGFSYPIHCTNIVEKNIFTPRDGNF